MAIDPIASAQDALLAWLGAEVDLGLDEAQGALKVLRGWPEHNEDFDLATGPVLSTTVPAQADEVRIHPLEVARVVADGEVVVTYRTANLQFVVQLDLWCAYRAALDVAAEAVAIALDNQVPSSSGLWLTQAEYFGRPLSFEVTGYRRQDDADSAAVGEWRATWLLRCTTDRVVVRTYTAASTPPAVSLSTT
ncbi:hypothetical protein [uncultured Nocardioides sp.]|uniref:hypothetical protein n=1 Tax=uncultured Nocardioides sp. TaxID=198441 RepID=UPI00262E9B19|nr:hypothetical protein [uncultured Nocardioides sp.]